ncbi:hypothetical protein F511_35280 [Dorcoceras hygrometricum]|uniref:Uncharacterized protein n=1 Tax=Dorcoceras hygrometricum TaxID=472368 RepID=A0A2Z7BLH1_9LAMI|nr:hypothetical protein F511_35280 [Dorcoceras hygrometricum]
MLGTEATASRTQLPESELNYVRKPQEPSHATSQLLTLSDPLTTPNWYKNVYLEEGFPTEVSPLKSDQSISGNLKKKLSVNNKHEDQAQEPAQGVYAIFNQHNAQLTSSSSSSNTYPAWITYTNSVWSTLIRPAQTSPPF